MQFGRSKVNYIIQLLEGGIYLVLINENLGKLKQENVLEVHILGR